MRKITALLVGLILTFIICGSVYANVIIINDAITTATEVDQWYLTLGLPGTLTVNVLANESAGIDFFGNGYGNDLMDSYVYLFTATGTLVTSNDDSPASGPGGDDGSHHGVDSYFSTFIPGGNYILSIGDYDLSQADAWDGINEPNAGDLFAGSYRITLTSSTDTLQTTAYDNNVVPEPASILLLGIGGIATVFLKRKKA